MINMALSSGEIRTILDAMSDPHTSPALVLYLKGKEKQAKYAEAKLAREARHNAGGTA